MSDRIFTQSMAVPAVLLPKEHFNDRTLTEVIVPDETAQIGSWAYGKCVNLREITIPYGCEVSDKAFEGCSSLEMIYVREPGGSTGAGYSEKTDTDAGDPQSAVSGQYPRLLALAVRNRPSDTARIISAAMRSRDELLALIDELLPVYLMEPDDTGFVPFLAGGEEDYDDERAARDEFVRERRFEKVRLVYERLRAGRGVGISDDGDLRDKDTKPAPEGSRTPKKEYAEYLKKHNPEITFPVLTEPGRYTYEYRKLYFDMGLNRSADTETLLEMAKTDTVLRAMVLTYALPESGCTDLGL